MKELVVGRVPVLSGHELRSATIAGGCVSLNFHNSGNKTTNIQIDHVIAATGIASTSEGSDTSTNRSSEQLEACGSGAGPFPAVRIIGHGIVLHRSHRGK